MIKRFNIATHPLLSSAIDEIEDSLQCPKYQQVADKIKVYLYVDRGVPTREMHGYEILVEKGFGACIPKFLNHSFYAASLVINMEKCSQANLTQREMEAVLLHELGHILNVPELPVEPILLYCFENGIQFNREILEETQESNTKIREVFADSYVNQHGYGQELIATFHKQDKYFEQKTGFASDRIEAILKQEYVEGEIMAFSKEHPY